MPISLSIELRPLGPTNYQLLHQLIILITKAQDREGLELNVQSLRGDHSGEEVSRKRKSLINGIYTDPDMTDG